MLSNICTYLVSSGLIKTLQRVLLLRSPKIGCWLKTFITLLNLIWSLFHLNNKTPVGFNTRKHSLKPLFKYGCQLSGRTPYLSLSQLFLPACNKWGGSKTTRSKVLSSKGKLRKSPWISGAISTVLTRLRSW